LPKVSTTRREDKTTLPDASNGGVMRSMPPLRRKTVHTLFSGPAAGAQAAVHLAPDEARPVSSPSIWADLMRPRFHRSERLLSDRSVIDAVNSMSPALDLATISAGALACLGRQRGFPQRRTAQRRGRSGPACYGRGGTEPSVTGADLRLGYLNPDYFLGGSQKLNVKGLP